MSVVVDLASDGIDVQCVQHECSHDLVAVVFGDEWVVDETDVLFFGSGHGEVVLLFGHVVLF